MADHLVPLTKFDTQAAERAAARGWPGVQPVISGLLMWLQDMNWPVSRALQPFLAEVGAPLAPYLRPILSGDDGVWKYWIITKLIAASPGLVDELYPDLVRLATRPTADDRAEAVDVAASDALDHRVT